MVATSVDAFPLYYLRPLLVYKDHLFRHVRSAFMLLRF